MTDDDTRKINTEADDADATMVLSTQELASQIDPDARPRHADDAHAVTATALLRIFGRKRNVDEEIEEAHRKGIALRPGEAEEDLTRLEDAEDPAADLKERYRIVRVIAEGGQAKIALAVDRCLNRKVALKSMRQELLHNEAARHDFLKESRVTASLDHPAIVPIYSLNSDAEGGLHLAMKLMNGRTLKKYLSETVKKYEKEGISSFDETAALAYRLDIFLKICDALSYVHDRGVIHCDLKPENIMLGEYRETYVMDWGIARAIDEPPPPDHRTMGTPRYTSPENLLGRPCDARSDIYTMGVILFELATLSPAFPDTDLTQVIHKVRRGDFAPLRHRFGAPVRRDLAAIIRKATAADPDRRYQRIDELAADIRRFIRGDEVSANPDGLFGKLARWGYRHRKVVLLLAALGFVGGITIALLGTWWNIMRQAVAAHQRDMAITEAFVRERRNALAISDQFLRIGHQLETLEAETRLLNHNVFIPPTDDGTIVPVTNATLPRAFHPPHTDYQSSIDCATARSMLPDPAAAETQLRRLQPLFPRLRATVFESPVPGDPLAPPDDPAIRTELLKQDLLPVRAVLLAMADGLQTIYPGRTGHAAYDGRTRPWYHEGMRANGATYWGTPYVDFGTGGAQLVVSCSRMIGDRLGVVATDVPLDILNQRMLLDPPPYLLARMLVDADGNIIAGTAAENGWKLQPHRVVDGAWDPRPFEDPHLFKQMKTMQAGYLFSEENGRTRLWLFNLIRPLPWLYIEKVDYPALLERVSS